MLEGIFISLEGSGVDKPEQWEFHRVYPIGDPEENINFKEVEGKITKTFLNKEIVHFSIKILTRDTDDHINDTCERLIDCAIEALNAGEELRLIIREEKEKYVDWYLKMNNTSHTRSSKHIIQIDSLMVPGTFTYSPLGEPDERR